MTRPIRFSSLLTLCGIAAACSSAAQPGAEEAPAAAAADPATAGAEEAVADAVTAVPEVYSVMHEDDRVRVVKMALPAGKTDGLHSHPHEVVYFTQGGKAKIEVHGGDTVNAEPPAGAILSNAPWAHTVTNEGDTDIEAVIVELKQEPGQRAAVAAGTDAVSVAPTVYAVLNDDERARVLEMKLGPGQKDGEHTHPDELVYFIKGGKAKITTAEGAQEMEIADGFVLSHEGWTHTVENVGDTEIHAIIFELK